jgi:hypothetical protein
VEEGLGLALGFGNHRGRDPMVLDVEKAGIFGRVSYLRGEGSAGCEVAVDGADVNEGDFRGLTVARWGG